MRFFTLAISLTLLLTGCTTEFALRSSTDLTRELAQQQVLFELEQELMIPAGTARVFMQDGGVVGKRGLGQGRYDLYRPHCALQIDVVDHSGFRVSPEIFEITRVERSVVSIVDIGRQRLVASSARVGAFAGFGAYEGGVDRLHDGYHLWLKSDEQPAVMRLSCYGIYAAPVDLYPPTLDEINAALGEVGTVRATVNADR